MTSRDLSHERKANACVRSACCVPTRVRCESEDPVSGREDILREALSAFERIKADPVEIDRAPQIAQQAHDLLARKTPS